MAKRFTDTDKYKKPFIRGLQGAYKLLWDYLYHDCNHAGIWIVEFDVAQIYLGSDMLVNKEDALKYFNKDEERVIEFEKGKWFIPSFIDFQYGELKESNRAHNSVINILTKNKLINNNDLVRGLYDPKDKDKDKDKFKDKDTEEPSDILNTDYLEKYRSDINTSEHDSWRESFYMKYKFKKGSLGKILNAFIIDFKLREHNKHSNIKDFKEHFINWVNVQDRLDKLDNYKQTSVKNLGI